MVAPAVRLAVRYHTRAVAAGGNGIQNDSVTNGDSSRIHLILLPKLSGRFTLVVGLSADRNGAVICVSVLLSAGGMGLTSEPSGAPLTGAALSGLGSALV